MGITLPEPFFYHADTAGEYIGAIEFPQFGRRFPKDFDSVLGTKSLQNGTQRFAKEEFGAYDKVEDAEETVEQQQPETIWEKFKSLF